MWNKKRIFEDMVQLFNIQFQNDWRDINRL